MSLPDVLFFLRALYCFVFFKIAMMEAEKAKDPMEGLEPVWYPSKYQLASGEASEPEQKMGDYVLTKSEHETGRVLTAVRELGVERGVGPGSEVRESRPHMGAPERIYFGHVSKQ